MEDGSTATFRPTWQQVFGRGLCLGVALAVAGVTLMLLVVLVGARPSVWVWLGASLGGPLLGAAADILVRRRTGTQICSGGIRTLSPFADRLAPWSMVVDLREERRGGRTVVSVYLDSGASVQLDAPYSGQLLDADPKFETKMFALSYLSLSHRFGGLSG